MPNKATLNFQFVSIGRLYPELSVIRNQKYICWNVDLVVNYAKSLITACFKMGFMGRNSVLDRHWTGFFLKLITHRITIFLQICLKLLCLPVPASLIFCFVSFFLSAFKTFMQFSADRVRLNRYIINRHRRRVYRLDRQTKQGRIQGGERLGAPPPPLRDSRGVVAPPPGF